MEVRVDLRGFGDVQRELGRISDGLKRGKATQMALNKVAEKGRAEVVRGVTERFAIKSADVRVSIALRRATRKSSGLMAVIDVFGSPTKRGRSMNMIRFLAALQQQRARGSKATKKQIAALGQQLGFTITKGGGLKQIPGAFVGNKGRTIFHRVDGKQMASRSGPLTKNSQAIEPVQVIGVSQMFKTRTIERRVMQVINDNLLVETQRAVRLVLERRG